LGTPTDGNRIYGPPVAPLGLPAAPDGCERHLQHLPGTAGCIEAIAELRVHDPAEFRVHVVALENGEDGELQLGQINAFEAGKRLDSRHGCASYNGGGGRQGTMAP
jgi:hypothetical protein